MQVESKYLPSVGLSPSFTIYYLSTNFFSLFLGAEGLEDMTAQKIRALITEIGNNNVVNSHSVAFEQCSCCSGRLITV